jgi:hypothetical protein
MKFVVSSVRRSRIDATSQNYRVAGILGGRAVQITGANVSINGGWTGG